jgi:uncharacterized repeat protein (TIGR03803 family)
MLGKKPSTGLRALAIFAVTLLATSGWAADNWKATVLHSFDSWDGSAPQSGLIFDAAGNLYGTTVTGGTYPCGALGCGTVFELTPVPGGGWTETVLHSFSGSAPDGLNPYASLVFDAVGNLYGTTAGGGTYGYGTVFELSPAPGGGWRERVLHSFANGTDGAYPVYGALIFDAAGNLYGTTSSGGTYSCQGNGGCGTVFELSPTASGGWTETVLYDFGRGTDGYSPEAGLVQDAAGNLYGTTTYGGANGCAVAQYEGCGTVFELTPAAGGRWTETVVHDFGGGTDAATPVAGLTFDTAGNLYGTTESGGSYGFGTVFELSPAGTGWSEKVIYSFNEGPDGYEPTAGTLVFDTAGSLYGTAYYGGSDGDGGTAFQLTQAAGGAWTETALYSFALYDGDWAGLIFDADGNLYGTTWYGGTGQCDAPYPGCGTVFELSPVHSCFKCSHAGSGEWMSSQ